MGQDLIDDLLIFDTTVRRIGKYLYGTPAMSTGLHINIEHPFRELRICYRKRHGLNITYFEKINLCLEKPKDCDYKNHARLHKAEFLIVSIVGE